MRAVKGVARRGKREGGSAGWSGGTSPPLLGRGSLSGGAARSITWQRPSSLLPPLRPAKNPPPTPCCVVVWVSGIVQTILYLDFFYYYIRSWKENKKLALPA